jgi:L-alanine-DL-glutamate epimerase-like enolase superfamily enzyme
MIDLSWRVVEAKTARTFRISAGATTAIRAVIVEARDGEGNVGYGEATPAPRVTGESEESIFQFLDWAKKEAAALAPDDWRKLLEHVHADICGNGGARAGLDLALHDLAGKRVGVPAHELYGMPGGEIEVPLTVSLDLPDAMAREAKEYFDRGFSILKIKLGQARNDEARLAAIRRAVPQARLRVDANEGWSLEETRRLGPVMFRYGVEFVEQPLPRGEIDRLAELSRTYDVAVVADESVADASDVERLLDRNFAGGVNVKIQKAGGIMPARAALLAARDAGLQTQLGCNVETGVGIGAGTQLISLLDWADLDGNVLLAEDPFDGAKAVRGTISTPRRPGLGASPR